MSKELVISSNRHETRVALLEDDQLVEVHFQRSNEYSLAGSIHKGRVTRVLPGMQSAFVDIGLERDTFLYVSDFLEEDHGDIDKVASDESPSRGRDDRNRGRDRGRGRDFQGRDRDGRGRDARPPREVQPTAEATGSEVSTPEDLMGSRPGEDHASAEDTGAAVSDAGSAATASPVQAGHRGAERSGERDRHGRRRRRRGGRQGFPESKYAAETKEQSAIGATAEAEVAQPKEVSVTADAAQEESLTPLVLPGESLRKYRGASPFSAPQPVVEPNVREDEDSVVVDESPSEEAMDNEYDEPIHYPPENAVPDAPIHRVTMDETQTSDDTSEGTAAGLAQNRGASQEAAAEPNALDGGDTEADDVASDEGPAVASMLDDDEDRDIQAMILGDIEGIEISDGGEASASEGQEGGGEGAVEGGTAVVRERSGRFPHRMPRRRRGRGRGSAEARGPEAGTQAPGADAEARGPELQERSERAERTDRPERERQDRIASRPNTQQVSISDLLKEGQEIIVQIAKEPLGQKGARITSHIALPGRYVVYMPTLEHMGVSRKIGSDEERQRLKKLLQAKRPGPVGGFITRTAAEGRTEDEIAADMLFLYNLWQDIKNKSERKPAPLLLHHDLDIVQRILRDQLTDNFKAIWIDNEEMYENVLRFVERFQPALVGKVKLYTREAPIFDAFNITNEMEKALRPKVWLKSGGFIVINQTEALVAIDVNTGKYVGKTNRLEDTIVKTNTEAIREIVRQIRLRDLGGIIVIDFIDMDERKNRQKVMQALEEAMRVDRAPYKILQFNDFGLVAITRKRVKQSLERTLCSPCPHCEGAGYVKSVQTVVGEILTEARKLAKSIEGKDVMLRVHPDVGKVLKSHQNKFLEELEEVLRRPVLIKSDPQLHHEKFDLA